MTGEVTSYGSSGGRGSDSIGQVAVPYSFKIDGKQYSGKRYTISSNQTSAELTAARKEYTIGKEITICYDPADPTRSAMSVSKGSAAPGIVMITLGALGYIVIFLFRMLTNKPGAAGPTGH